MPHILLTIPKYITKQHHLLNITTELRFTCSNSATEKLGKGEKYAQNHQ